ncbi:hypothetical protein AB1Y20_021238 [Prymnesium parvum]|uniref:RING-type domain-containing protein n=1 Tax=Prymnesium parvum TaxID=97485 RepID=A0AB34JI69_PRYPA
MGAILCRFRGLTTPTSPSIVVKNQSGVDVVLWLNGGGPVARAAHGEVVDACFPPHLDLKGALNFLATMSVADGGRTHQVLSSLEVKRWVLEPSFIRSCCVLEIPSTSTTYNNCQVPLRLLGRIVCAQRTVRQRVMTKKRIAAAACELRQAITKSSKVLLEGAIRKAVELGVAEHEVAYARAELLVIEEVIARKAKAARTMQAAVRNWLTRRLVECPVCLDDVSWPTMHKVAGCHKVCVSCISTYVEGACEEGKLYIRCPGGFQCTSTLSAQEIGQFCSSKAWNQYQGNMACKHTQRLADENDVSFLKFCREHARRCPACQVIIWRSAGCNSMQCRCGQAFNWDAPEIKIVLE